jgi:hypothetical protein
MSKPSTKEALGKFKKKHPELPSFLGDYNINRQIMLACQQSGGGGTHGVYVWGTYVSLPTFNMD